MSLVGNLEDLNLGDILQIISLSQKSGVLSLRTGGGEGRIVFVGGLVRGAAVEGGPRDLRGVLLQGGFLASDAFEAAARHAEAHGMGLAAAVDATTDLSSERIDSLCRESVESAVVTMFCWQKGDFSFDVRTEPEPGDPELLLPTGMNAQYLAMEAARMRDESGPGRGAASAGAAARPVDALDDDSTISPATDAGAFDAMSAEEMFGVMPSDGAAAGASVDLPGAVPFDADDFEELEPVASDDFLTAADALAVATLQRVEAAFGDASDLMDDLDERADDDTQGFSGEDLIAAADLLGLDEEDVIPTDAVTQVRDRPEVIDPFAAHVDAEREAADEANADAASGSGAAPSTAAVRVEPDWDAWFERPVVVVDESLPALEWVKTHLKGRFAQVHIFQRSDQGLARIRQYLIRGAAPILLVAPDIRVDHLSGLKNARDFVDRLKAQSRKLDAVWLVSEDADAVAAGARTGAALRRPSDARMRSATGAQGLEAQGAALADRLGEILLAAERLESASAPPPRSAETLARLRDTTRQLADASSGGEILPLVIRFASEIFGRVAMFMVRDDVAQGLGQSRLDRCGGPDDESFRKVRLQVSVTGWFRKVIESGASVSGPPSDEGDRDLAGLLGDRAPASAYCAPIESAGHVVALLYADNLPASTPIGDTSALEVVLHHAGLALDRAALERALQEEPAGR